MKNLIFAIICLFSSTAFADWQIVQCKDIHSDLSIKLKFTEGYVQVMNDETSEGKPNSGSLVNSQSEVAVYRGLTLYSDKFGWQETYEGNGLKEGEARLLVDGTDTMVLESTAEEGNLDRIILNCEAI